MASYTKGGGVRGNLWLAQLLGSCGGDGGGVREVLGERGEGGPSMTTTFSLRLLLLRFGSPKNAESNKSPERLFFFGCGLSSNTSTKEGRPDEVEDRGGVFNCLMMNSDVGSPYSILRGVFSRVEWLSQGLPGRPYRQRRV